MKSGPSLRMRMMMLFCVVVGVLLAGSYLTCYLVLSRVVRAQFDRRLIEASAPLVADLQTDANLEDVFTVNVPDEYFEALDSSGNGLALSKNLAEQPLVLPNVSAEGQKSGLQTIHDPTRGRLRVGFFPLRQGSQNRVFVLAMPTLGVDRALASFRNLLLLLLPCSLILTAVVSAWYVGRSLRPIASLTQETERMAEQVRDSTFAIGAAPAWSDGTPLRVTNGRDEVARLAEAYNKLFACVEKAFGQLRQFVSDASHELRTPLSVLQGETELLLKEPRTLAEYQGALHVMDDELKKLGRIIEGLFTLAMADAGRLPLTHEPLYLNEVLEEACALIAARAKSKGIVLERALDLDLPFAGDETFLRQLFLIFLDNAVKYSPPGSRVQVEAALTDGIAQVKFEDQGPGIACEHLPHIFERFYRAPQPEYDEAQSGGLGLAIAQAIVRAHGGSIECSSQPGMGSTFIISLAQNTESAVPPHLNKN